MEAMNFGDRVEINVGQVQYKGTPQDVNGITVRWLSRVGTDASGNPEHGLRHFTIQPGGVIPIHDHFYHQTMYILDGQFECWEFDPKTDRVTETSVVGPGDFVYVAGMAPHGMKNIGDTPGTFLCCIANVYDKKD